MKADAVSDATGPVRTVCDTLLGGQVPGADELFDFLWYLQQRFPEAARRSASPASGRQDEEGKAPAAPPARKPMGGGGSTDWPARPEGSEGARGGRSPLHGVGHPSSDQPTQLPGTTISSPAGHPLPERLLMSRSLRPVRRWIPRHREESVDEEATAERLAETPQVPCIVPRRVPERSLDLILIVERSPTMDLWGRTLDDFHRLLLRTDVFRNIARYELHGGQVPGATLRLVHPASKRPARLRSSAARAEDRLVCLFTDGLSWIWRDGRLLNELAGWGRAHLTTVFHLLPVEMWPATALRDATIGHAHSRRPGAPSWEGTGGRRPAASQRRPVLLAAFSPAYLSAWARTLGASPANRLTALVLPDRPALPAAHPAADTAAVPQGEPSLPDPEAAVATFRACASPLAWHLAKLLAAAPLYPPVMRLVQQALLPESTREHLAEVLLGGLVWRPPYENEDDAPPEETLYDFLPPGPTRPDGRLSRGARQILLDEQWIVNLRRVLEEVSRHVESRFARHGLNFKAILEQPQGLGELQHVSKEIRPFALVGAEVLMRLGGEYAVAGQRLQQAAVDPNGNIPPVRPARYALLLGRRSDPTDGLDALQRALADREVGNFIRVERGVLDEPRQLEQQLARCFRGRVAGDVLLLAVAAPAEDWPLSQIAEAQQPGGVARLVILGEIHGGRQFAKDDASVFNALQADCVAVARLDGKVAGAFLTAVAGLLESGQADLSTQGVVTLGDLVKAVETHAVPDYPRSAVRFALGSEAADFILARNPRYRDIPDLGLEFLRVPAGRFVMGSPENEAQRGDDETQHTVTLTHDFFLGMTPVTQAAWVALMESGDNPIPNPSHFKGDPTRPVDSVTWDEVKEFCRRLTEREHLAGRLPDSMLYTLPTEAEWEYACRAGTTSPFAIGDGQNLTTDIANFDGNYPYGPKAPKGEYRRQTTPLKLFPPNPWGHSDMHGNVYEWCEDWYGEYPKGAVVDPLGPAKGAGRVRRGGSWNSFARWCRSAVRDWGSPDYRFRITGFRVVAVQAVTRERTRATEAPSGGGGAGAGEGPKELEFVEIKPGTFMMGSPEGEAGRDSDETQHTVTLTKPFRIARYPVTQHQYEEVMGTKPSYFKNSGPDAPVENVSWNDAVEFCRRLTEQGRKKGRLGPGWIYSLPTEAQWEYACRAGSTGATYTDEPWGILGQNHAPALDPIAWYGGNSRVEYDGGVDSSGWPEKQYDHQRAGTHPVGAKEANSWGLYDMLGNVYEWCWDSYGVYPTGPVVDPTGPTEGAYRVRRGGCWDSFARWCRSARRDWWTPDGRNGFTGFRVVAVQAGERETGEGREQSKGGEGRARSPAERGAAVRPETPGVLERLRSRFGRKKKQGAEGNR